jgi:hypothetical protein
MSQQGPGGYGGFPPGGGPPGGHGGYPPGPGQPPGGYGPPGAPPGPGGPGGWGQPPGYGAPPPYGAPPAPAAPPPKKGTSPVLWIGLGCGVLLLFGGAGAAWFLYSATRGITAALEGAGLTDGGISISVPPAGAGGGAGTLVVPGPGDLATGGPVCDQAAKCCRSMVAKSGGNPAAETACDNLKTMPRIGCTQAFETYKRSAPLVGATCP